MKWQIPVGEQAVIGVHGACEIVVNRLAYIVEHGSSCNQARLISEALEYATLVRGWVREHQPKPTRKQSSEEYIGARRGGKPGPLSDG
jgi:hypothetical protein